MAVALRMIARGLMISLFVPAVSAATIEMTFTATNFAPLVGAVPPIDDPVSGTIRYEAASINAPIDALTSVSLVIAGHMYTLAEIGFDNETGVNYIGGLVDGVLGSGNFEDDFQIGWDTGSLVPLILLYAASGSAGLWITSEFSQFAVVAVPEPATMPLLALALCAFTFADARRRRSRVYHAT